MLKKLREMMNVKIRLLRGLLEEAIKNIDAGNSNHTEEELNAIIDDLTKLSRTFDKGFHTKGEAVARCDNELPLSSF